MVIFVYLCLLRLLRRQFVLLDLGLQHLLHNLLFLNQKSSNNPANNSQIRDWP